MRQFPETWILQKITDAGNHKSATITRADTIWGRLICSRRRPARRNRSRRAFGNGSRRFGNGMIPKELFYGHIGQA